MTNASQSKKPRRPAKPKVVDARWSPWDAAEALFNEASKAAIQDQNHKRAIAIIAQRLVEVAAMSAVPAKSGDVVEVLQPTFDKTFDRLSDVARRLGNLEILWREKFGPPDGVETTSPIGPEPLPGDMIEIPVEVIMRQEGNLTQSSWEPSTISDAADEVSLGFDHTTDELTLDKQPAGLARKYLGNPHPEKRGMSRKDMAQAHLKRVVRRLCQERGLPVTKKMIEKAAIDENVDLDVFTKTYIKNVTENTMISLGDFGYWPSTGLPIPKEVRKRSKCLLPRQRQDYEPAEELIKEHNRYLESIGEPILVYRHRSPGKSHKNAYQWAGDKKGQPVQSQMDLTTTARPSLPRPVLKPQSEH